LSSSLLKGTSPELTTENLTRLAVTYNLAAYACQYARIPDQLSGSGSDAVPFNFQKFPYMMELYADMFPTIVIQKCVQVGASEYAVLRAIHACDMLASAVMYGFPHSRQMSRFSKTRVGPVIRRSDRFRTICEESALETKTKQTSMLRTIKGRFFYLVGVASDAEIQSEPVDFIIRDEFDLMDQDNAEVMKKRNAASTKKMILDLGFPLVEGMGINELFLNSDQREYEVRCPSCGLWQEIKWPRNVSKERMERICWKCGKSIESAIASYRWGRWTPREPRLSETRHGYHIHRLLVPGLDLKEFIANAENQMRAFEFSVYDLGLPFTKKDMRITDAMFMECVDPSRRMEDARTHKGRVYGGADVGSVIHVWLEIVEEVRGKQVSRTIDAKKFSGENKFEQLVEYLLFAEPVVFCIDAYPETTEVMRLIRRFPMMVWGVKFDDFTHRPGEEAELNFETFIIKANRTFLLDCNVEDFTTKRVTIPGELLAKQTDVRDHFTAPVRVQATIGSTDVPIFRWVTPRSKPDHWAFARAACIAAQRLESWIAREGGSVTSKPVAQNISYREIYNMLKRR
jgi:hypothetical protein